MQTVYIKILSTALKNEVKELKQLEDSIKHDHDYGPTYKSQLLTEIPFIDNIKEHNRILSLRLKDQATREDFKTSLNENGISVFDISQKHIKNKRILLIGSQIIVECQQCLKPVKRKKSHACPINRPKPKPRPQILVNCSKCDRMIAIGFQQIHLEKHYRDDLKKLKREKERKAKEQAALTCPTCKERCRSKEELYVHLSIHPPYICDKCGKGFIKKESLLVHHKSHNDRNSFICEFCGKCFKEYAVLRIHLQGHKNQSFKCRFCPKVFKNKNNLNSHVRNVHIKMYQSQCMYCGKQFLTKARCNYHIRLVHLKVKPYECHICHKKFGRLDYLHNHRLHHTREPKPMKDPSADKELVRRHRRILRYKIHDNDKPVSCRLCGKWCKNMIPLKRHLETHFKRYPCQFCPLTFSRKAFCQRHEKIHQGGTLTFFRCDVCWKRFNTKEALEEHALCHTHQNGRYPCDLCEKSFNRRFLLNHHNLVDHTKLDDENEMDRIIFDNLLKVSENPNTIQWLD